MQMKDIERQENSKSFVQRYKVTIGIFALVVIIASILTGVFVSRGTVTSNQSNFIRKNTQQFVSSNINFNFTLDGKDVISFGDVYIGRIEEDGQVDINNGLLPMPDGRVMRLSRNFLDMLKVQSGQTPSYQCPQRDGLNKRGAIDCSAQLWPNATMQYLFTKEDPVDESMKNATLQAMKEITEKTGFKFELVTEDYQQPFVGIRKRLGCASEIGRTNRNQYLSLGQGCDSNNVIHHELMHAMGFQHEQNRPDRDDHVRIKFQNIDESSVFNFQMINHTAARSVYELISVMHYASNSFIKNGLTCTPQDTSGCGIVTKDNKYIPYAVVMTDLDVEIIKKGYNL